MSENGGNFLSPIILDGPFVSACDFWVDEQGPEGGLNCSVNINEQVPHRLEHDEGASMYRVREVMRLHVTITDKSDEARERMHATLVLRGLVSIRDSIDIAEDKLLDALRLNAVSLFYSSARSYIEFITGQSPMGRFTIPAIDPNAYIRQAEKSTAE